MAADHKVKVRVGTTAFSSPPIAAPMKSQRQGSPLQSSWPPPLFPSRSESHPADCPLRSTPKIRLSEFGEASQMDRSCESSIHACRRLIPCTALVSPPLEGTHMPPGSPAIGRCPRAY